MSVQAGVQLSAARAAARQSSMDRVRGEGEESYLIPHPDVSGADRLNGTVLDFAESEGFNYAVTGASAAVGVGGAVTTSLAGGATAGAAALSGAAALGTFAVVAGAGLAGFWVGGKLGGPAADWLMGSVLGKNKIATDGDAPARQGDPIAHVNKNLAILGAIVGAVLVIGVGIATCGAGLVVMAAATAAAGVAGGFIASAASTAGQYGDNKGHILSGSPDVFFEGRPVARVGDPVLCSDHPGSPPPVLAEGAKTVFVNSRNLVRIGHRTTCDGNINDGCTTITTTKQTSTVYEVKDSTSPWLRWTNVVVNLLPLPRGGRGNKPRANADAPAPRPNRGNADTPPANPHARNHTTESVNGRGTDPAKRCTGGEPVDLGSGDFLQIWPVLEIPGTIPLQLRRLYRSTADFSGLFGGKWADDWSQYLRIDTDTVWYRDGNGVDLEFYTPEDEVLARNLREGRYLLFGQRSGALRLNDRRTDTVLSFEQANGDRRHLSDIEDRNGNRIHFEYHEGRLARITHSDGFSIEIETLENGALHSATLIDPHYRETPLLRCDYDEQGYPVRCESHQFGTLFHRYDAQGHMVEWRDRDQTRVWIQYDDQGRVIATDTPDGAYRDRFTYDGEAACTHYYDAEGGHSRYFYNTDGLVTRSIDPLGHVWETEWDEFTQKLSETDPLGRTTRYGYTPYGEVLEVIMPDRRRQRFEYDDHGHLLKYTGHDGARWQFRYDARGNLTGTVDPEGRRTGYRLGDWGQILRQDNPDGSQLRYRYDTHRRPAGVVYPDGSEQRIVVDVFGRIETVTDPLGRITRYEYDAGHAHPRGSASACVLPNGVRQVFTYDEELRLSALTNGEGHTRHYRFGAFDRLTSQSAPGGQGLSLRYDHLNRLTQVKNSLGDVYRYDYDAAGRLRMETDFAGTRHRYAYNAAGWLVTRHGSEGVRIDYDYDLPSGRLIAIRQQSARCDPVETRLTYDPAGHLIGIVNADAVIEYERDALGRILSETVNGRTVRYDYDLVTGRLQGEQTDTPIRWAYDLNGALAGLTVGQHAALQLQRNRAGEEVGRFSPDGFSLHQRYDPIGQLLEQRAGTALPVGKAEGALPSEAVVAVQRRYRYDRAFNPIEIDDARWGRTQYRYSASDLLIGAEFAGTPRHPPTRQGWDYDAAMNLIAHSHSQQPGVVHETLRQKGGRVIRRDRSRYRYDRRGRLVEKIVVRDGFRPQHWYYGWNADDRLIELVTPQGERWRYAYDALGRRVRKF
ncbi:MAG: PAAR domain-containing protein [Xanthomonadaceae bacterium]|jgi:YD repeat-containing protein|nr:PAAR domain-containing protein [Xanthomonadaceae bacterium]